MIAALALSCRVERVAPGGEGGPAAEAEQPSGDLWVYTSIYRPVLDALDPLLQRKLPKVRVHWFQAGSEKVASRLEAELSAGAPQADVLATSDRFFYERLKQRGLLLRYASPEGLRTPRALIDLDGHYAAGRIATMVIAHRAELEAPPKSFRELADPRWKGEVALGDPLTSGTAFTWAVFVEGRYGADFFRALRRNGAVVAGGNAAVQQRLEAGEAKAGVLLLENVLAARAKGSPLSFRYPDDGAVMIPGDIAILASTRNPRAAKALVDLLLSPEGQEFMVKQGNMHAVDPRAPGPAGEPALDGLLERSQPWNPEVLARGLERGASIKSDFSQAFAK
ncbi:MAG TPA: ABC transporter substrate-binding protein [Myxococcaceae bacterium]|nr:ABC transporter substrate-binding protein [Myxococcaceae bacterium]